MIKGGVKIVVAAVPEDGWKRRAWTVCSVNCAVPSVLVSDDGARGESRVVMESSVIV